MPPKRASSGPAVIISGPVYSDGDASHRPDPSKETRAWEEGYLQVLADTWMRDEGRAQPGRIYKLDRLPAGYEAWERPRPSNPKHVDRWLYGHPSHKKFDSPNRFVPHFKYLMKYASGEACKCDLCSYGKGKSTPRTSSAAKRLTRPPPLNRGPVDEEGTPDLFCALFSLLKHEGSLSRTIEETASLDWRAEKPLVDTMAKRIPRQPSFKPRNGETVLYLRPLPLGIELRQDPKTQQFVFQDTLNSRSAGCPRWFAGVVTQVPSSAGDTVYPLPANGSHEPDPLSLSVTGYRIEPLPSINDTDKNLSKQHSYVPLNLIRPFCFWKPLLQGIPGSEWHVSIQNAIIASATVSLVDRQHFTGLWPDASILSRGIHVGAECYWIGDTVRLLNESPSPSPSTVVMRIQQIVTTFHNLIPEPANPNVITGNRCDKITVTIKGPVYSNTNLSSSTPPLNPSVPAKTLSDPMQTFNTQWYPIGHPDKIHSASFSNIHSRLYESSALESYFPSLAPSTLLHLDTKGENITHARSIAAATDERIAARNGNRNGKRWFWAGCRAVGLDLASVNGVEVAGYDGERRPKVWREVLGVVDGRRDRVEEEDDDEEGRKNGDGSELNGSSGGDGGGEEDDDVMEIDPPDRKEKEVRVVVQVPVPVQGMR
ncbi:MAG: hypothetical protein Q9200_006701 [Gallowayella weberi]